ncbi:hypothetical protein [Mesorhizobium ventifaucium]|nr:hypothetical protein [Mesorhizobium ventifaucium]
MRDQPEGPALDAPQGGRADAEEHDLHRFHNWLRQRHEALQPKP